MTSILIALGLIVAIIGFIGSIVPVVPGPFISYASLIVMSFARDWEPFSAAFLIATAAAAGVVSLLDNVFPAVGARRYGASKAGVWSAVLGMLAGLLFFPPWGIFIGAFAGVFIGEMVGGVAIKQALRAGWGVFIGTMAAICFKVAFTGAVLFVYVYRMIWPT